MKLPSLIYDDIRDFHKKYGVWPNTIMLGDAVRDDFPDVDSIKLPGEEGAKRFRRKDYETVTLRVQWMRGWGNKFLVVLV